MKLLNQIKQYIDPFGYAVKNGMIVGKGCTLASRNGTSFGSEPYLITLEDEVRLSGGVTFITHDGGTWAFRDKEEYKDVLKFGAIKVGYRTFVGYGATIMPGVTIGKRCVIGAGAVVTKDVPDGTVVAGVPAKVICSTEKYAEKCMDEYRTKNYDRAAFSKNKKEYLIALEKINENC